MLIDKIRVQHGDEDEVDMKLYCNVLPPILIPCLLHTHHMHAEMSRIMVP